MSFFMKRGSRVQIRGSRRPGQAGTPRMLTCLVWSVGRLEPQYTACRSRHNNILLFSSFPIVVCAVVYVVIVVLPSLECCSVPIISMVALDCVLKKGKWEEKSGVSVWSQKCPAVFQVPDCSISVDLGLSTWLRKVDSKAPEWDVLVVLVFTENARCWWTELLSWQVGFGFSWRNLAIRIQYST